jgi:transposase-like protein
LTKWRKQRERGVLQALAPQKRGPKPAPQAAEIARLRQENEQLRGRLQQVEQIMAVQKKLAALLGTLPLATPSSAAPSSPPWKR